MESIDALDAETVHRICSNQVVLDLQGCVKELVENSIDAGATHIEVKFIDSGGSGLEVVDNGCGIPRSMYSKVTSRHCTSKIKSFADIQSELHSFGFRGEALSSICALSDVSICTRCRVKEDDQTHEAPSQAEDSLGESVKYDHAGKVIDIKKVARSYGTTVKVCHFCSSMYLFAIENSCGQSKRSLRMPSASFDSIAWPHSQNYFPSATRLQIIAMTCVLQ